MAHRERTGLISVCYLPLTKKLDQLANLSLIENIFAYMAQRFSWMNHCHRNTGGHGQDATKFRGLKVLRAPLVTIGLGPYNAHLELVFLRWGIDGSVWGETDR